MRKEKLRFAKRRAAREQRARHQRAFGHRAYDGAHVEPAAQSLFELAARRRRVGFVDLGEVKVEARLTTTDADVLNAAVRDRTPVDVVVIPVGTDDEGNEIVSYAFAIAQGA